MQIAPRTDCWLTVRWSKTPTAMTTADGDDEQRVQESRGAREHVAVAQDLDGRNRDARAGEHDREARPAARPRPDVQSAATSVALCRITSTLWLQDCPQARRR